MDAVVDARGPMEDQPVKFCYTQIQANTIPSWLEHHIRCHALVVICAYSVGLNEFGKKATNGNTKFPRVDRILLVSEAARETQHADAWISRRRRT